MRWLRSPYLFLVASLALATVFYGAYIEWWRGQQSSVRSLDVVLALATISCAIFLLVALISVIAAVRWRGAPLHGVVALLLGAALILGTLWALAVGLSLG